MLFVKCKTIQTVAITKKKTSVLSNLCIMTHPKLGIPAER